MRVAVICEHSGRVRDAFATRGHYAISCDILPSATPGEHIQGDCRDYRSLWESMDLIICHPPCTFLSNVANRALKEKPARRLQRKKAYDFCMWLWNLKVPKLCLENPKGFLNNRFPEGAPIKPQIIQPYYFGDREMKTTCLWLRGLPPLQHYSENDLFHQQTHTEKPEPKYICQGEKSKGKKIYFVEGVNGVSGAERAKIRSTTFFGIAAAMADQWG